MHRHGRALCYVVSWQNTMLCGIMAGHYVMWYHGRALCYVVSWQSTMLCGIMAEHYVMWHHGRALCYVASWQSTKLSHCWVQWPIPPICVRCGSRCDTNRALHCVRCDQPMSNGYRICDTQMVRCMHQMCAKRAENMCWQQCVRYVVVYVGFPNHQLPCAVVPAGVPLPEGSILTKGYVKKA